MNVREVATGKSVALSARNIVVDYHVRGRKAVRAVDDVSLDLASGETLGLVGESGCGKSSLGRSLVQLPRPTSGTVSLGDVNLSVLGKGELRLMRRKIQLIFQDPISSLNPRRTGADIVAEPLKLIGHRAPEEQALKVLAEVGVDERMASRRPHELSGGQCQRVSIARALVQQPDVLVCDEPVSALDVSVQAQVLNLLEEMKQLHRLSIVFVSHDLAVVRNISDRVAVMYLGKLVEVASSIDLYAAPKHHYTVALLASIPKPRGDRDKAHIQGEIPRAYAGVGCRFASRCPAATDVCRTTEPALVEMEANHFAACHHPVS